MNCLFWNIRGIGIGEKIVPIRSLVEKKKVTFMGLAETKHKRSVQNRLKRMWGNDDYDFCEVYASETNGGGVIAVWDKQTFIASSKHMGSRWILIEGCINSYNFECRVGVIYGHNDRMGRCAMFEEIKQRVVSINKPILMLGDFNVTLHAGERTGSYRCDRSMNDFSEWITDLRLLDLPLHGLKFTWRRNESKSRLDKALCFLINEWRNIPNVPLHNKLKILKTPLKAWRSANFDCMDNKIADFEVVIHDLEQKSDNRMLDTMEKARLNAANSFLHQWLIRRERIWRQRARSYGFKLKDHNSKFFLAATLYKKKEERD
ncbi:uncharacterized protein LOC130808348 [Amaranthus tricolor]|uniref:uncharacterized protein LOC130808348 n=1 Tax=Amaranthus tricolor TaxID=29722 RepID=UPI00258B3056|nr:uncharacterized protein LOC130808348 [Amaranthus tricolor]